MLKEFVRCFEVCDLPSAARSIHEIEDVRRF